MISSALYLAAYEAYMLGKQRTAKFTSVAFSEAAEYFQQAIELDPGFALAYVRDGGGFGEGRDGLNASSPCAP